ncbi:MAG: hypothetical protein Q8Q23_02140 [bacterium]|nr:hypothetical protein [bacterium]
MKTSVVLTIVLICLSVKTQAENLACNMVVSSNECVVIGAETGNQEFFTEVIHEKIVHDTSERKEPPKKAEKNEMLLILATIPKMPEIPN